MDEDICRILSLDGGGAKGFYSLGILREVEALLPRPIHETFDLIFGTSTGSIIAALLAIGRPVEEIHELYKERVPTIMRAKSRSAKSEKLRDTGKEVFGATGALLHNSGDGRGYPLPGQTYPTASVTGMP
uniref:patatin-like phospholipase family protein n=1 Tax=Paracoccus binzhouensis TaxID=2796149 RepID=UPI0018EEE873